MAKVTKKSKREIRQLREGGKILAETLALLTEKLEKEGGGEISTKALDQLAEKNIRKYRAEPSFLGYNNFPASLCVSLNNEIVHGVPKEERIIQEGDLIKLDLGVKYKGLFTDSAISLPVGQVSKIAYRLIDVTRQSLMIGLEQIYPGFCLGNYGAAVDRYARKNGFSTVKSLVGHGVGYAVHEPPQITNFGKVGEGLKIEEGMVLALEPMLNEGKDGIKLALDELTFLTEDGKLSAHFEHTVAVTNNGCEILTEL
ncbi:MAG TPA: type I methionyl aminopeptidase [Candidatus Moranbacteria bacterium]|nr:type I methionyl aminopeptidase [Candidatus Moranbacteria bacterium]